MDLVNVARELVYGMTGHVIAGMDITALMFQKPGIQTAPFLKCTASLTQKSVDLGR